MKLVFWVEDGSKARIIEPQQIELDVGAIANVARDHAAERVAYLQGLVAASPAAEARATLTPENVAHLAGIDADQARVKELLEAAGVMMARFVHIGLREWAKAPIAFRPMPQRVIPEEAATLEDQVCRIDPDGAYLRERRVGEDWGNDWCAVVVVKGSMVATPDQYAAAASTRLGYGVLASGVDDLPAADPAIEQEVRAIGFRRINLTRAA